MSSHAEIAEAIARLKGEPQKSWSEVAKLLNRERITTIRGHKFTEMTTLYYKDLNKVRFNIGLRRERIKASRTKGRHTADEWRAILTRADGHCECCGQPCDKLHKDHIELLSKGGSDSADNIRAVCRRCSTSRGPHLYPSYVHAAQV